MKQKDEILRFFLIKISAYKWKLFNISFVCFCFFRKDRSVCIYGHTYRGKKISTAHILNINPYRLFFTVYCISTYIIMVRVGV